MSGDVMRVVLCLMLALAAAGCTQPNDPFERPGTWSVTGANEANLKVMVADPHDLIAGRGESDALSADAAPPVQRLRTGKRFPLPSETSTSGISAPASTNSTGGENGAGSQ
jgi:hypothetical protein